MSTEEAFLCAIREHPNDDLPRLVFADWLDEQGQPERAEFIRVQCELARVSPTNPRPGPLTARSYDLAAAHGNEWGGELYGLPFCTLKFHRGFVDSVYLSSHGQDRDVLPPLRATFARNAVSELEYGWSEGVPANRPSELLLKSVSWPEVRSLRRLTLSYYRTTGADGWEDAEIDKLAGHPHLAKLARLRLGSSVSPTQLARLGRATFATSLHEFRAMMGADGDPQEWCRVWKQLPFVPRLTELDLGIDWHTDDTLANLLEAELPDVRSVILYANDFTDGVFAVLGRWPQFRHVHTLNLQNNNLGPNLLTRLAELKADGLRVLHFGGEMFRNRRTRMFFSQSGRLAPDSVVPFAHSPLARQLTELMVTEVLAGGPLLRALTEASLGELTKLTLWRVECERSDLQRVLAAEWFGRLRYLRIGWHAATDADAELFLDCPLHPEAVLSLDFGYSESQVSADMKRKLRERYGPRIQLSPG